jgi:hypothetical protein
MYRFWAVLALLVMAFPLSAIAQSIEIKGLRMGMTKAEVKEKFPTWKDFTIAGVRSRYEYTPVHIQYRDEKLDQFMFFFNSSSFEAVLGAIKEKYPETVCESTQVGNAMGATFEQIRCSLSDNESVLQLSRYVSDIRTSVLSLVSKKSLEEQVEKAKQRKKDI